MSVRDREQGGWSWSRITADFRSKTGEKEGCLPGRRKSCRSGWLFGVLLLAWLLSGYAGTGSAVSGEKAVRESLVAGTGEASYGALEYAGLMNSTAVLGVGGPGEMYLSWQGPVTEGACVRYCPADEAIEKGRKCAAVGVYEDEFNGLGTYRAVMTDLLPGEYHYQIIDGTYSDVYGFTVTDDSDGFSFLCAGDPQIEDAENLAPMRVFESLAQRAADDRKISFLLSLGDQADVASEAALYERFTDTPLLKRIPLAPLVGNHEKGSRQFSRSFYMPNMDPDTEYESGDMSGDYWFMRGNTLFLCLNANNKDAEAHADFMRRGKSAAEERYGTPVWTVAALHRSPFSAGFHAYDEDILATREAYTTAMAECGVDVVLTGHDHIYVRTKAMDGTTVAEDGDGILYFTLGSSTGTKLYAKREEEFDFVDFLYNEECPMMMRVDVTEREMTLTTYLKNGDDFEILDEYSLKK